MLSLPQDCIRTILSYCFRDYRTIRITCQEFNRAVQSKEYFRCGPVDIKHIPYSQRRFIHTCTSAIRRIVALDTVPEELIHTWHCEGALTARDWATISQRQLLSEAFLHEHRDNVVWTIASKHQKLSESFIGAHADLVDWDEVSFQHLNENFIRTHADKLCWERISAHQTLSEEFLEEFACKVNWDELSVHQTFSEEFVRAHLDRIQLEWYEERIGLSEDFIRDHVEYIREHTTGIVNANKLSEYFMREYRDLIDWDNVVATQPLSESFLEEVCGEDFPDGQLISEYYIEKYATLQWEYVSRTQKMTVEFIRKHKRDIYWSELAANERISDEDLFSLVDCTDWETISYERKLPLHIIEEHRAELSFWTLYAKQKLPREMCIRMAKSQDWVEMSTDWSVSFKHMYNFEEYLDWFLVSRTRGVDEDFLYLFEDLLDEKVISFRRSRQN